MIAKLCVLPGDGIGPEVMAQAQKVLAALPLTVDIVSMPFGGAAIDATGTSLPVETLAAAQSADAVLLGAVGGPKWDELPTADRPERGLLALRKALDVFANLRPAITYAPLYDASTLKRHVVEGLDILIVRELTGGIYFGEPRGVHQQNGTRVGINTLRYDEHEIRRVAKVAFALAQQRQRQLTSVDKANVLEATQLWRKVVDETAVDYPDVAVSHMYVDNAAMQLVRAPKQFDVVLTTNMFGDILSDCAAMLTGSIGLLPSASLNAAKRGIYEPVHGSAPDIAGRGIANPLAMIASLAMCLRYTLAQPDYAAVIEQAIAQTLADGVRTADIAADGMPVVDTDTMGDAVCKHVSALLAQHGSAERQEQKG